MLENLESGHMQAHKWDSNKVILVTHVVVLVGMIIGE